MAGARYVVGIDLGTTNTACAWVDTRAGRDLHVFEVPQLVAAGRAYCVGTLAREQGARVPGRLVASAKSWLCHGGVDRTAAILPWGAPEGMPRVSPVEASARILTHVREAWDATQAEPLAAQDIVLTVPASFDEVARE